MLAIFNPLAMLPSSLQRFTAEDVSPSVPSSGAAVDSETPVDLINSELLHV